jgi:CoA-dependent NAD(P)H sulfur oxidoreductase
MSKTVIIVGGNASGLSAASQVKRLQPGWRVIVYEKGQNISYASCGMPYFLEGIVSEFQDLLELSPETVINDRKIDLHLGYEVLSVNPEKKEVTVTNGKKAESLVFDYLLLATGALPSTKGIHINSPLSRRVFTLKSLDDMLRISSLLEQQKPRRCGVIGGGYIAVEMLEAFVKRGLETHLVHRRDQLANTFEPEISAMILEKMKEEGIVLDLNRAVQEVVEAGDEVIVRTDQGDLSFDFILIATGVEPNTAFLQGSGIELGIKGSVAVNKQLQTNYPYIYGAGDCAQTTSIITGRPAYVPLAPKANKEGFIAGANMAGGNEEFPGIGETAITKFADLGIARTGLTHEAAVKSGFNAVKYTFSTSNRPRYYPGGEELYCVIVIDREDGRILGAQLAGPLDGMKRIDVFALLIQQKMTVGETFKLDLAYAPPFSPVYDPVILAARLGRKHVIDKK